MDVLCDVSFVMGTLRLFASLLRQFAFPLLLDRFEKSKEECRRHKDDKQTCTHVERVVHLDELDESREDSLGHEVVDIVGEIAHGVVHFLVDGSEEWCRSQNKHEESDEPEDG